jgi:hypothetical protein
MALSWQQASWLTAVLGALAAVLTARHARWAAAARETTMISGLYAVWQLAGQLSGGGTGGAIGRAGWIERTERHLGLPSEASVQRLVTGHGWLVQAANYYYATMHFGVLFVFLAWLFFRHRDRYRPIRRVLAYSTLACLLIQLIPVAPPRLLPGYVDTAMQYHQSVYSLGFDADQLSAMPSVHVAWAALIGVAVALVGSGPWRWLGAAHAGLTVFVVVATANHFWLDGIVGVAVVGACALLEVGCAAFVRHHRRRRAAPELRVPPKASILA